MTVFLGVDIFKSVAAPRILSDDIYDRLSRRYSIAILGVFLVVVSSSQLIGKPLSLISCWCPAEFTGEMVRYAVSLCWTKNTYYLENEKPLPSRSQPRPPHVSYYQWVPFILLYLIFMFYLPGFVWRNLNKFSSINSKNLMHQIMKLDLMDERRIDKIRSIVRTFDYALVYHKDYPLRRRHFTTRIFVFLKFLRFGKRDGNFLVAAYIFSKVLYIANAVGHLFLLNLFLGCDYSLLGMELLKETLLGVKHKQSTRFPIVTMCDFNVRGLADNKRGYTVQCTLPINIFNEKIFITLWYWLVIVSIASIFGLIKFLCRMTRHSNMKFIEKHLSVDMDSTKKWDDSQICFFINEYCRADGMFILRLIEQNMDEAIVGEIVNAVWDEYISHTERFLSDNQKLNGAEISNTSSN